MVLKAKNGTKVQKNISTFKTRTNPRGLQDFRANLKLHSKPVIDPPKAPMAINASIILWKSQYYLVFQTKLSSRIYHNIMSVLGV